MMQEIKEKLRELATLLQAGGERDFAHTIDKALKTGEAAITDSSFQTIYGAGLAR